AVGQALPHPARRADSPVRHRYDARVVTRSEPLPLLPTTMVGSYPRPGWFTHQLAGRDVLEAFKVVHHKEAFEDAVKVVIDDQHRAGLDVLADGQMWFDDYGM